MSGVQVHVAATAAVLATSQVVQKVALRGITGCCTDPTYCTISRQLIQRKMNILMVRHAVGIENHPVTPIVKYALFFGFKPFCFRICTESNK